MTFIASIFGLVEGLRARLGDVEPGSVTAAVAALDDDAVLEVLSDADQIAKLVAIVRLAASGVIEARSGRDLGHSGLAQRHGHRTATSLLQELTGASRTNATGDVRVGSALLESEGLAGGPGLAGSETGDADAAVIVGIDDGATGTGAPVPRPPEPWHAPLGRALTARTISSEQHAVILRGLGEPPSIDADSDEKAADNAARDAAGTACSAAQTAIREAWSLAAEHLIEEAANRSVEELGRTARSLRDQLDPEGAALRYQRRFENRSFRQWIDEHGQHRASMNLDDHAALWIASALNSALRPRRGGPRFVDPDEKSRAGEIETDPRTIQQLSYDLIIDILRAGMLAEPEVVFGTRQAGVRLLITHEAHRLAETGTTTTGASEDEGMTLPAWVIAQHVCESGVIECHIDTHGNPLYLGREQRLFSPTQRVALAIRDGGCRWRGCDRPASYCEAHHIDEYDRDQGRTDIDRGILLCRWHHMELHHGGYRITRDGDGDFVLHPPPERGRDPIVLAPRLARKYLWGDIEPPLQRFHALAA